MVLVTPHSDMQTVVTMPRLIAEDILSQLRVKKLIQTVCEAFELRISAQIKANSLFLLTQIQQLKSKSTRLESPFPLSQLVR
jgi:response regulator RpfG family c-di-GMP phosphodiesterase